MMRTSLWYIVLLIFFLSSLKAQQLHFNTLDVNNGLSQHDVSSIFQDSNGLIWIGTYDGLNRFDGYKTKTYFHDVNDPKSLSSNRIKTLFEDNNGKLWIGTDGYGLNVYDLNYETITRVTNPDNYTIVNDIVINANDELIIATNNGLLKVNESDGDYSAEIVQSPITGYNVKHICLLNNGDILYATNRGVWLKNEKTYKLLENTTDMFFNWIIQTANNEVWLGSDEGLFSLDETYVLQKSDVLKANVLSIEEGIENDLWIGTFGNGLYHFDLKYNSISKVEANNAIKDKTLSNNLKYVFKDASNTLWLSNQNGLLYSNLENNTFRNLSISNNGHVRTLFATDSLVYYGCQSDKYYVHNLNTKENEVIDIPYSPKPFKVDTINGTVHLATTKGLYKKEKRKSNSFKLVSVFKNPKVDTTLIYTSFVKDSYGNQYLGTFRGVICKTNEESHWIHEEHKNLEYLRNLRVYSLEFDHKENCLWLGTISKGLYKINLDINGNIVSAEHFSKEMKGGYKINNNTIWCFYKTKDNVLYLGTDAGLLFKKPDSNRFESLRVENILNKKILGITEDNQSNLWLTNSQGIISYNPQSNLTKTYNYFDGLQTSSFTQAVGRNTRGEVFFGSIEGINYLNPSDLKENLLPSNVAFTSLFINNKEIAVNEEYLGSVVLDKTINALDKIELNYKQNDFTIEFTNTNYAKTKVNTHRYKLDNYDKAWNILSSEKRYASFSNMPAGTYTLYVESANPEGQWMDNFKSIEIQIYPAPWNTWWAYGLYLVLLFSIISIFLYFYTNKQNLKNQIALSQLKSEKEKEINELKLIFFTDVAHEFKTPLSLVIGPLNELITGGLSKEHKEFCYNILSRSTNRMMNLVNQLLDFRTVSYGNNILKVSRNDMCAFVRDIAKSFEWQAKDSNITFNIISPESYYCHFDKGILEKVIYNLLSNAFKYTPNSGTVVIELKPTWKQELEYFIIIVKDSGKGISQVDKQKIFERHFHGKERSSSGIGLHLTSTLLEAHRGEINVLNSSLGGTEFMVTLPVSSKAFKEDEYLTKEDIPNLLHADTIPGELPKEFDFENDNTKEKILIVEDDYDLRKYLSNLLHREYHVLEAVNGKEGLEVALKTIPDIILSDVMMPEMDGIEMCKKIKTNVLISHIPILMLTAKTGEEFFIKGLKVGAWDYIAKPFDSKKLTQKIKNITQTRNSFRSFLINGKNDKTESHYVSYDQKFVKKVTEIISNRISETKFSVEELSKELGLSRMQLHRKLKSLTGFNSSSFINKVRIDVATRMFDSGCDRVQEAMDAVGINSYAHFNNLFKKEKGLTPSKYILKVKETV